MSRDSTGVSIPMGVADWWSRSQSSQTTIQRRSARCTILGWWTFLNASDSISVSLSGKSDPSHVPKRVATVVRSPRSCATIPRTVTLPAFRGGRAGPLQPNQAWVERHLRGIALKPRSVIHNGAIKLTR